LAKRPYYRAGYVHDDCLSRSVVNLDRLSATAANPLISNLVSGPVVAIVAEIARRKAHAIEVGMLGSTLRAFHDWLEWVEHGVVF
jgi:hypothetical protein